MKLVSPALAADLAEAMSAAGHRSGGHWDLARAQLGLGPSWALRDGAGTAIVVAGLVPIDAGAVEAWFVAAPAAARHLPRLVRIIRLTLDAGGYRQVRVVVTTAAGARLARLAGFVEADAQVMTRGERRR